MDAASLFDPASLAIVVGGTLAATVMQCGWGDCRMSLAGLAALWRKPFNAQQARAELSSHVRTIRREGLLRAPETRLADRELDEMTGALIGARSLQALLAAYQHHQARRRSRTACAAQTLEHAAGLAPMAGLAGTLIALSRMAAEGGVAPDSLSSAIGMAVLTTLYGLVLANLVLAPLSRKLARAGEQEDVARAEIVEWITAQLRERATPAPGPEHANGGRTGAARTDAA